MSRRPAIGAIGCLLPVLAAGATARGANVVVAVDVSRSLSAGELRASTDLLAQSVARLEGASCGVVVFHDTATWLVPRGAGAGEVGAALAAVRPSGRHTVLREALVMAARELEQGGLILLATDGRDEDSAATDADVTQLLASRPVRVIAVAVGRAVDARELRRLAVISGGEYVGRARDISVERLAAALDRGARSVPPIPAPAAAAPAAPAEPAPAPVPTAETSPWLPWALGLLLVAAALAGAVAWRVRRGGRERTCPDCGRPMATWETACSFCTLDRLHLDRVQRETPQAVAHELITEDDPEKLFEPSVFEKAPTAEQLEKTFVLQERTLLIVRQNRKPTRSYLLDPKRVVAVGRAHVNSIVLDDPTLSAQHFKLVPKDGEFFVLDLGSTNGTVVNGQRTRVHRLEPGDVISSGQVELEYRIEMVRPTTAPASA